MNKQNIILLVSYGAIIEDININNNQIQQTIDGQILEEFTILQHKIILNLYQAVFSFNQYQLRTDLPVLLLQQIHRKIMSGILETNGKIRQNEIKISGTSYIPEKVNTLKVNDLLLSKLNNPSIDDILQLQAMLMKMQPFNDGNKRSALIFSNYLLIKFHNLTIGTNDFNNHLIFKKHLVNYYENSNNLPVLIEYLKQNLKPLND
ncbi:Fic family protein [Mycoplasma nasistruthionis]|uniref:Fido domain-containing protein n=1 Tax=Mycoplasma nasistruthionis TaxID=353852 RepID=A0A4Y6I624_9MOLU|nr:Fic family protein [Mycoplasma nasistruthionis]QDF64801.1 hypothetical protein FIV53_00520 [Mycoplasma nasistruthionis]